MVSKKNSRYCPFQQRSEPWRPRCEGKRVAQLLSVAEDQRHAPHTRPHVDVQPTPVLLFDVDGSLNQGA
jgi:hypothetical protein